MACSAGKKIDVSSWNYRIRYLKEIEGKIYQNKNCQPLDDESSNHPKTTESLQLKVRESNDSSNSFELASHQISDKIEIAQVCYRLGKRMTLNLWASPSGLVGWA